MPRDLFGEYGEGMAREPDMDDPAIAYAERAMKALQREFYSDDQVPRFVVIVETPPNGEILTGTFDANARQGIASTGDDELDTYRMALLGTLSIRRAMSDETHARAVEMWEEIERQFKLDLIARAKRN